MKVMKAALVITLLLAAGASWAVAPATQPEAAEAADDSKTLDGNLQKKCAEAGVAWGGYSKAFDCRPFAKTVQTQYAAYKTAKAKAEVSESTEDWEAAADLAVYTYVQGHIYNRIARNIKNAAQTRGTLKSKAAGTVEGISIIDREKLGKAIAWYTKAQAAGNTALKVSTDTEVRDKQSKEEGQGIIDQAESNITWIQSLLDDSVYNAEGRNKWMVEPTSASDDK